MSAGIHLEDEAIEISRLQTERLLIPTLRKLTPKNVLHNCTITASVMLKFSKLFIIRNQNVMAQAVLER